MARDKRLRHYVSFTDEKTSLLNDILYGLVRRESVRLLSHTAKTLFFEKNDNESIIRSYYDSCADMLDLETLAETFVENVIAEGAITSLSPAFLRQMLLSCVIHKVKSDLLEAPESVISDA